MLKVKKVPRTDYLLRKDIEKPHARDSTSVQGIRIILISRNARLLENVRRDLINGAKKKNGVKDPKTLCITSRKIPCGEGSQTWKGFQMRNYKLLIITSEIVKKFHLHPYRARRRGFTYHYQLKD